MTREVDSSFRLRSSTSFVFAILGARLGCFVLEVEEEVDDARFMLM